MNERRFTGLGHSRRSSVSSSWRKHLRHGGILAAAAAYFVLLGCASASTPYGANDPANPDAPTSAPSAATSVMADGYSPLSATSEHPEVQDGAHSGHGHERGHGGPEADVYACPMHPEEQSNEPGRCSKCGMKLERQSAAVDEHP